MNSMAQPTRIDHDETPWTATDLMKRWGYSDRPSFWDMVHTQGVPYIHLNSRTNIFPRAAVLAWEQSRSVGKTNLYA
jgi:hypothetical protein